MNDFGEISGITVPSGDQFGLYGIFETASAEVTGQIIMVEETTVYTQLVPNVFDLLVKASETTGSYVELSPEFYFCPVLKDDTGRVVPLYEFVEILDELIDYEDIKKELPTFSFAQINGAISFLRKVAQFNTANIDIDAVIDEDLVQDPNFLNELRRGIADQESNHVLNLDQLNR